MNLTARLSDANLEAAAARDIRLHGVVGRDARISAARDAQPRTVRYGRRGGGIRRVSDSCQLTYCSSSPGACPAVWSHRNGI